MVQVEHRKRFAGEDHLVVVQPDGTLALIPAWMSEDIARSATLTAHSRDGDQVFQAMVITASSDRDQFGDEHG